MKRLTNQVISPSTAYKIKLSFVRMKKKAQIRLSQRRCLRCWNIQTNVHLHHVGKSSSIKRVCFSIRESIQERNYLPVCTAARDLRLTETKMIMRDAILSLNHMDAKRVAWDFTDQSSLRSIRIRHVRDKIWDAKELVRLRCLPNNSNET